MTREEAARLLKQKLAELERPELHVDGSPDFMRWRQEVEAILRNLFGDTSPQLKNFRNGSTPVYPGYNYLTESKEDLRKKCQAAHEEMLPRAKAALEAVIFEVEKFDFPTVADEPRERPKAFIAHGGVQFVLNKLKNFLSALGVEPLVVEEQPSTGMAVDDKVEFYLGEADCAIILATADDEIDGKLHPRQNVVHEIGLAQKAVRGKIIYLLEQYAEFPSNIGPKVWERFDRTNMESAFIRVAKELKAFGIIRAVR